MYDKRLEYVLKDEKLCEIDYRRIKRNKYLDKVEDSLYKGWTRPKGKKVYKVTKEQQEVLERYLQHLQINLKMKSALSVYNSFRHLFHLAVEIPKPFEEYTEKDIRKYLATRRRENKSINTLSNNAGRIRQFFNWLYENNKEKANEVVGWIKTTIDHKQLKYGDLLTEEEIKKMSDMATNERDRLIPIALFESGCRCDEFCNIKIGDFRIDGEIVYVDVEGKTGKRTVFLKHSIPYLKAWLNNHPLHDNKKAPLFISLHRHKHLQMANITLTYVINTLAKKAGITKKVYPHLFRHSRATNLTELGFNEAELRIYFGWSKDSKTPTIYTHLGQKQVSNKFKTIYNIKQEEKEKVDTELFTPKVCGTCGTENPPSNVFCKCGRNLKMDKFEEMKTQLKEMEDNLEMMKDKWIKQS